MLVWIYKQNNYFKIKSFCSTCVYLFYITKVPSVIESLRTDEAAHFNIALFTVTNVLLVIKLACVQYKTKHRMVFDLMLKCIHCTFEMFTRQSCRKDMIQGGLE